MKKLRHLANLVILTTLVFSACKKDDIIQPPKPVHSNVFQFAVDSLPGLTAPASEMFAVISIVNSRNEAVITDKKLSLQFTNKFFTEKQELPAGSYKLTKFFVVTGAQVAKYVTPVAGSVKAAAVQKPLAISFSLPQSSELVQTVEVLKVDESLREESYGYAYGSFRQVTIEPETFIKVKIKGVVQVGSVVYDSIPASFTLTSWDKNGQVHRKDTVLDAGAQEISLPGSHNRFQFTMLKWGVTDVLTVNRADVSEGALFVLDASKQAKKLRSEITYIYRNGVYVPKSKINYLYEGTQLANVQYYENFPGQNGPVMTMSDVFYYNGNKLRSIERFDADNVPNRLGTTTVTYDAAGRLTSVDENFPMTDLMNVGYRSIMDIEYHPMGGNDYIHLNLKEAPGGSVVTQHRMKFAGGNKTEVVSMGNHYNGSGLYSYDLNINPYIFMGWPGEKLSRQSRNNLTFEEETTYLNGGSTLTSRNSFWFVYDADGYPTEKIKRDYNGQPVMKVVYTY